MNQGRIAFVWVADAKNNIFNLELVRRGAFRAEDMFLKEEDLPYLLIPRYVYDGMKSLLLKAEIEAKREGLGIWKHSH